jgi:hypothetical protein
MNTKHITILAALFASAVFINAQDAAVPTEQAPVSAAAAAAADGAAGFLDNSPEAIGAVTDAALESAQNWIAKKGWVMGANPDGRHVAVGAAPVSANPSDFRFSQMRANAYTKAMLAAKVEVAKFIGTNIKSSVLHQYGQGSEIRREREAAAAAAARKNTGLLEKTKMLLSAKLDNELKTEGVAMDSPQAAVRAEKLLNSDQFNQLVETSAKAAVAGLVCAKIFEENGRLAVVAYYSDNTRVLAGAIAGTGAAPVVPPNPDLGEWIAALAPAQLYPAFGVQLKSDENGSMVVLSFGQAVSETNSPNAVRNARTQAETMADGYIRQFAGEAASYDNVVENLEKTNEFDNGVIDATVETFQETVLKTVAPNLKINGIQIVRNWQTKDTRSGKFIVGVVKKWTLTGAQTAKDVGAELSHPPAQNNQPPPTSQPRPPAPVKNAPYKIESMESADF